jgi:DUF177 domain-containing protein
MPSAATRGLEVLRLARQGAQLDGELAWDALPRLVAAVSTPDGTGVHYSVEFAVDADGGLRIEGECSAQVVLRCQRCMGDVTVKVVAPVQVAVTQGAEEWRRLDPGVDPVELDEDGRIDLESLLEDELLLALPLVPMHEDADCHAGDAQEEQHGDEAFRPFAALDGLIRRSDEDPKDR